MAKLVAKTALDMTAWETQFADSEDAEVGEHDSTHFIADSEVHTYSFTGENFTYFDLGGTIIPTGGTVHELAVDNSGGSAIFNLTGLDIDVVTIAGYIAESDWTGLAQDIFSGNDTFTGSNGADHLVGFGGKDKMDGKKGGDMLQGDAGADRLTGGDGNDRFDYFQVSDSTRKNYDTITDLNANGDKIGFTQAVTGVDSAVNGGALSTNTFDDDLKLAIGNGELGKHHAVLFTPSTGTLASHTFLIVDGNGKAGYQKGDDLVIDVSDMTGTLGTGDFLQIG